MTDLLIVALLVLVTTFVVGLLPLLRARRSADRMLAAQLLGTNGVGIVLLLSKDLLKLIAVAFVVGAPLAFFAMNLWLENFTVRVGISWGTFLLVGLAALGIAWLTVSYHAIRAALTDPVNALRYE